ncbi:MAG: TIR domain-containing protein [Burkholderiaceae bacterium]|nr:TIR domain-containing protein [Burkholderiaceae bacterium]
MTSDAARAAGPAGVPTAPAAPAPRVFISYSHDSPEHQQRVRALCEKLRGDGIDALIDQYVATAGPPQGWPRWMDEQLRLADLVVLVCTPTYRARVEGRDEPGRGHGVLWEGSLVYQLLYNAGTRNERFVPVLLGDSGPNDIPLPLQGAAFFRADDPAGYEDLYRRLTGQPRVVAAPLGQRRTLPPLPAADPMAGNAARESVPATAEPSAAGSRQARPVGRGSRRGFFAALAIGAGLIVAGAGLGLFGKRPPAPATQSGTVVTGVVVDNVQRPIAGATVTIVGSPASTVTDAAGFFSLPVDAAAGQMVQIRAQAEGWEVTVQGHPAGKSPATLVLER